MNLDRPDLRLPATATATSWMTRAVRSLTAGLSLTAALAAAGCDNKVDETKNYLPIPAGDAVLEVVDNDATAASCDCLVADKWFRFDTLQIVSLDKTPNNDGKHPVITTLNPLWQEDINRRELNFFFHVKEVTPTQIKWEVVNGARVTGTGVNGVPAEVCSMTDTKAEIITPRDGCNILKSQPAKMNVYAGTPSIPKNCNSGWTVKNVIPLSDTFIQGLMSSDCKAIGNGLVVQAVIPKKALDNTCTCLTIGADQMAEACGAPDPTYAGDPDDNLACGGCNPVFKSLTSLLNLFGQLQYGCTLEDGDVGVCLEASFSAVAVDTAPQACQ